MITIPNPAATDLAIAFIVLTGFFLILLILTWSVCCCWRYKLHKRKQELKYRDMEQGIQTVKPKGCGCCGCGYRCCGCWVYTCRSCRCCCEHTDTVKQVVPVTAVVAPSGGVSGGGAVYGWSKDAVVYGSGGCANNRVSSTSCSQPVNFNNRWSSSNDGRLVLNGGGVVSRITPGAQAYGGIYPSMPQGISTGDQFQLRLGK